MPNQATTRIGLVLCSALSAPIPSTRIAVLNMLPALRAAGCEVLSLFEPAEPTETPAADDIADRAIAAGCSVVLFQKVHGQAVLSAAARLRQAGIATVYMVCDRVDCAMTEATDATVTVTAFLRSLYPAALQPRVHVVHDGIEHPQERRQSGAAGTGSWMQPLVGVLVSSAELTRLPAIGRVPPWLRVNVVARYASGSARLRQAWWAWNGHASAHRAAYLRFLLDPSCRLVPWHPQGVYEQLRAADIALIPIDTDDQRPGAAAGRPDWQVKSENRLTLKMAVGLPVVATPIPAYEAVIDDGVNGLFARSPADWRRCLRLLRDPALREQMGQAARDTVIDRFSMSQQARRLLDVFASLRNVT